MDDIDLLNTETRVYMENGKVKMYYIDIKGKDVDMKPHPTESRIFVKNGRAVTVYNEKIQKDDMMNLEEGFKIMEQELRRSVRLFNLKRGMSKNESSFDCRKHQYVLLRKSENNAICLRLQRLRLILSAAQCIYRNIEIKKTKWTKRMRWI